MARVRPLPPGTELCRDCGGSGIDVQPDKAAIHAPCPTCEGTSLTTSEMRRERWLARICGTDVGTVRRLSGEA